MYTLYMAHKKMRLHYAPRLSDCKMCSLRFMLCGNAIDVREHEMYTACVGAYLISIIIRPIQFYQNHCVLYKYSIRLCISI
jgi:hypothetical protein